VTALTRAGVTSVEDLAALTRQELAAINGLGPGMIAAIRLIVPEPTTVARPGASPDADPQELAVATTEPEPDEEESPAAPAIPSFDSLRAPPRHTALDVLVPEAPAAAVPHPAVVPDPAGAPRPAEYADLVRLGVRVVRAVAGTAARLALWSVREPVRCLRRRGGD